MQIIKQGNLKPKQYKMVCSMCGCEAFYDETEVHRDQFDGDYVVCPCCKSFITHKSQLLIPN